jgi:hypothetical protein
MSFAVRRWEEGSEGQGSRRRGTPLQDLTNDEDAMMLMREYYLAFSAKLAGAKTIEFTAEEMLQFQNACIMAGMRP